MQLSSLPVLIAALFGFLLFLVRRLHRSGQLNSSERNGIAALLASLLAWGGLSGFLSSTGVYTWDQFLRSAPGYWLPYIPVVIAGALVMLSSTVRHAVGKLVDGTPSHWLAGIHLLRISAIGTLIKASMGVFPEKFAWFVGIPDLVFGLSALPVTLLARRGRLSEKTLMLWHLVGALVILVPVAGLMHVFMREALFPELFAFPMALAPTLVVPTMVMLNLMVALRLLEKRTVKP